MIHGHLFITCYLVLLISVLNFEVNFIPQEAEISALEADLAQLSDPQKLLADGIISPELEALRAENAKLMFQVTHLDRV